VLLDLVDEAFDRRAWHGPTLYRSVRGVTPAQAVWRPAPGRHNIWEVLLHAAYWKHQVRRRLSRALVRGDGRARNGSFPIRGVNWFTADGRSWTDDVKLLREEHRKLRAVIARLTGGALRRRVRGRDTAAFTIRGIAAHDLYHAGQIQLLRRLQKTERRSA
jgi:hypothetical protein